MVQYECNKCHKKFDKKHNYDVHMNRKTTCLSAINSQPKLTIITDIFPKLTEPEKDNIEANENINYDINIDSDHNINNKYMCNYCDKSFCNKYTLERHLNDRCKIKKKDVEHKEDMFNKLMTEIGELKKYSEKQNLDNKKEISELKKQNDELINVVKQLHIGNNNTIINNAEHQNITNNNQNLNITINAYGKEDNSYLTNSIMKEILNKGFKSVEHLVQMVHFNKNYPQNHNIYISNIKENFIMTYDGNKWNLKNRDDTLQDFYDEKSKFLIEKFNILAKELDESTLKKFGNYLNVCDEDDTVNQIKSDIKTILYNDRNIPEETRKLININVTNNKKLVY